MDDQLEFIGNLEVPQAEAWRRCRLPGATAADHCRVPGFPSVDGEPGCAAAVLDCMPQKLLRCRKLDMPCAGTEIAIRLGPANAAGWPTRVTVSQQGFGGVLPREILQVHWRQIAADFLLYLEREITVPGTAWGIALDADVKQTQTGLAITGAAERGLAGRCGLRTGDLLLTVGPVRVHDLAQLWTVLALLPADREVALGWARGTEWMEGASVP